MADEKTPKTDEPEPPTLFECFGKIAKILGALPDDESRLRVIQAFRHLLGDDG